MKATEVVFKENTTHINPNFTVREPRLKPGDVLVVQGTFSTLGGHDFSSGDELVLIEKTFDQPHGFICTAGNWRVRTKYNPSGIWSSIERAYAEGRLTLKSAAGPTKSVWEHLDDG